MDLPPPLSDDACLEHLWRHNFSEDGQTARCPTCGARRRFYRVKSRPAYRCTSCGHYIHPTAGTIFHKSRTPLSVWFRAVRFIGENHDVVTASELTRELGVNYQTARRMTRMIGPRAVNGLGVPTATGPSRSVRPAQRDSSSPGNIWSFAGDGTLGFGGDGLAATAAQLALPYGVTVDRDGRVYIADTSNHVVRMVDAYGVISTVAGTGAAGYSGDGGPATEAQLHRPYGVAVDDDGALLVADSHNHVVRRVDTGGVISTVAGTGVPGFSGDGGPARAASLNLPVHVLPADGGYLISDQGNGRVRSVDAAGVISTIAGNGDTVTSGDGGPATAAGLVAPKGLVRDAAGNLYIAQAASIGSMGHSVRKVDPSGRMTTFAGLGHVGSSGDGGPATAALLGKPGDLVIDERGRVLICEHYHNRIRIVDESGVISTIVGTGYPGFSGNGGPAIAARLNSPVALALSAAGDLFITDNENNRIRKVTGPLA